MIGWGEPIRGARVRNDGAGSPSDHVYGVRWYAIDGYPDDSLTADPWTWDEVDHEIGGDDPYRLVAGDPLAREGV